MTTLCFYQGLKTIGGTVLEIATETLVPLHSRRPELLRVPGARQLLPEAGRRYRLEDGALL
jgi:hypothetical protein